MNDAVYVAKFKDGKHAGEWTATGTQFQVPYVFKKLFSKEPIEFKDMCETKSVTSALYLDMNENLPDVSEDEAELEKLRKKWPDENGEYSLDYDDIVKKLGSEIAKGHNYIFIGKVGQFCPIKPGFGGGLLMRETENKKTGEKGYAAATGSKGYRWLESEMVRELGKRKALTYPITTIWSPKQSRHSASMAISSGLYQMIHMYRITLPGRNRANHGTIEHRTMYDNFEKRL